MNSFAIVPAAGHSRRMGEPKLLLPWNQHTVIQQVIGAWRTSRVSHVLVVVPPEADELAQRSDAAGATVIRAPHQPADMKASVRIGLAYVREILHPHAHDVWLLAPADQVLLTAEIIDQVLSAHNAAAPRILVPSQAGRRGHPVLFPWPLAKEVEALPAEVGINALVHAHGFQPVECPNFEAATEDLDEPADYQRLRNRYNQFP